MKFLSQLFAVQDTDSTSRAFSKAWIKLVFLYLVIIAVVIGVFASLVVLQVNEKIDSQQLRPNSQIVLNANEALEIAQGLKQNNVIKNTIYSLEDNTLLFKVTFDDGEDVEVDLLTGRAQIGDERERNASLFELLTDNIAKVIWWIGGGVFLLASIGSLLVVRFTLQPISISTKKQKRFVSDAAHELRNPLASLQMTLESFFRTPQKTQELTHTVAEDMLHEVKRLVGTSESLLKLEEVEKRTKNILPINLSNVLNDVIKRLGSDLSAKEIKVTEKISSIPIVIDQNDIATVLYNLLHNAIKFSKPKSEIAVTWDGRLLQITDSGIGIDKKHLPHIFERFYKADPSRHFESNSNGLGLALVSDVVNSYGATITVASKVSKGTTFTIEF
jgi:signal transduction histidine kinase